MLEIVKPCPQSPYAQPQPSPSLFKPNLVPRGLGPSYLSVKKKSGGQREEGHGGLDLNLN